jgi:hypothetical protein
MTFKTGDKVVHREYNTVAVKQTYSVKLVDCITGYRCKYVFATPEERKDFIRNTDHRNMLFYLNSGKMKK